MKGEKFPSSQDHPLPLYERYVDYCDSGSLRASVRSSQNVAMVFFRIHNPVSSFTLTIRKHINPFREYDTSLKGSPRRAPSLVLHQDQSGNCCVTLKMNRACTLNLYVDTAFCIDVAFGYLF